MTWSVFSASGALKTAAASVGYGTSLPASPVDGQEYILVDSVSTPTYTWRFRYNSGSGQTDKWEFVGGTPARANVVTGGTTASTSYVEVGSTCSITLARAGQYIVEHGCYMEHSEAYTNRGSFSIGAAAASDNNSVIHQGSSAAGGTPIKGSYATGGLQITVAASEAITTKVKAGGGTLTTSNKWLAITPIRVS